MLGNDLRYALDPVAFCRERLGWEPDPWQTKVVSSSSDLLLNCSRQSGKTTAAAALATHTVIYEPGALVLIVSPSLRQSAESFRPIEHNFRRLGGGLISESTKLSLELTNGSRIVALPGTEGTIRGYSAPSLLIEDESARVPDETHRAVCPMLAVSRGRKILLSTPYGRRGHFHEEWFGPGPWERFEVPATDCPRISHEFLEQERRALGPRWFAQEYMCEFAEDGAQLYSFDIVNAALSDEVRPLFDSEPRVSPISPTVQPLQGATP